MAKEDKLNLKGNLEVWKVFPDGTKELHWEDHNVITSGMGVGLSHFFALSGGSDISDFQVLNFQVGVSGDSSDYGVSTFKLTEPLSSVDQYGVDSSLALEQFRPIENGSLAASNKVFPRIRFSNIHRINKTAVRFTLVLDNDAANIEKELSEIGLFMRNPRGLDPESPILVAYRPFTAIKKTRSFSLVFLWTLQF